MGMDNILNLGIGSTLDQMGQNQDLVNSVDGQMGNVLKNATAGLFLGAAVLTSNVNAATDQYIQEPSYQNEKSESQFLKSKSKRYQSGTILGQILGGVAGGAIGNQVGQGNGKTAATIIGAGVGATVGDSLSSPPGYNNYQVTYDQYGNPQIIHNEDQSVLAGAAVGGVAGGILGHQVGGGSGKKWATAAGAILGTVAGASVQYAHNNPLGRNPVINDNRYKPPVNHNSPISGEHPMSRYAPAFIAQLEGREVGRNQIDPVAMNAMNTGFKSLTEAYQRAYDSQEKYAQKYSDLMKARQIAKDPLQNMSEIDSNNNRKFLASAESSLNQISNYRTLTERSYVANIIRVLDGGEMLARNGVDLTQYQEMYKFLRLPLVDEYTIRHPATGQQIEVVTSENNRKNGLF